MSELIKLSIISDEGDTLKSLVPAEALEEIQEQVGNHGKWLFADGDFVNVDELREEDLRPEIDYTMTNLIAGGDGVTRHFTEDAIMDSAEAMAAEPTVDECCSSTEGYCDEMEDVPASTPYRTHFAFTELGDTSYDATLNVDVSQRIINVDVRDEMATGFIRHRHVIHAALEETLTNLAKREAKNIQDSLQVGCPISITDNQLGAAVDVSLVEDPTNDITIGLDLGSNTVRIAINHANRFSIANRRQFICHLFLSKLTSAGETTFNDMRKAVNV